MNGRFIDRVALITGGARGMGASHARGFISEGGSVVVADVLDDDGRRLAEELGPRAVYTHLDVTDQSEWRNAASVAVDIFGALHVLVNNAGLTGTPAPLTAVDISDWRRVMSVNIDGTFLGIRTCAPLIADAGGGSIVNISSFAGLIGSPLLGAYAASKFAIRGVTKTAAMELGTSRVRVNSVHPGYVETPMLDGIDSSVTHGRLAIDRLGIPQDVTSAVLFLASDDAGYITGSELAVDGGWSAGEPVPIFQSPGSSEVHA